MKNTTHHITEMFDCYLPKETWSSVQKVSIKYEEKKGLRWLCFINPQWCRSYSLKVTYKNNKEKIIPIPRESKDILKSNVMKFNFYLSTLQ